MEQISCDVLVLGTGAAGLRAAISARMQGLEVCAVSKGGPGKSTCTGFSVGTMRGARTAGSPDLHMEQTLLAGRGINQQELVEVLVQEAPERLEELVRWGIRAEFRDGFLFADGRPPFLGDEIIRTLIRKNKEAGTRFIGNLQAADLVMHDGAAGLIGWEQSSGQWHFITAGAVVLATGGGAALYHRHDNPQRILGDGYRLAIEAGALLQDMEFVQFYPVCLAEPGHAPLVIPPRLTNCGLLINDAGEDILQKYGIHERPAAEGARDRLSQALFRETYREGRTVFLDLRALTDDNWNIDPFSSSMRHIFENRYKSNERALRVAPAAHHTMGGVKIDARGATSVPGLFGAGEVTGGLHGANRLGGNALTETLVFGAKAGEAAAEWAKTPPGTDRKFMLPLLDEKLSAWRSAPPAGTDLLKKLRGIMWDEAGILRNQEGLTRAREAVKDLCSTYESSSPAGRENLRGAIELRSATRAALLIIEGALRRLESRGAHSREDFPDQNDKEWQGHLQVRMNANGDNLWEFEASV
ncbi:MAG: FAD-binding protein [Syntrophobacteraceae bacterium]